MIMSCWSVRASERPSFKSMVASFGESDAASVAHAEVLDCTSTKRRHTFQGDAFENLQPQSAPQPNVQDEVMGVGTSSTDSKESGDDNAFSLNESTFPEQSARVKRSLLLFKMLGYAISISIVAIVILAIWSNVAVLLTDTYVLSNGVLIEHFPVFDTSRDFVNFVILIMISYGLLTFGNVGMCDEKIYPDSGPKYAIVPLCLTAILPLIFYCIAYNVEPSKLNARYTLFNVTVYLLIYVILFIILDITLRVKWHQINTKSFNCKADEMNDKGKQDGVPNGTGSSTTLAMIVRLSVAILNIGFLTGYMLYIFPIYFGASVSSRMIICLIVHPIAVECNEALSRISALSFATSNDADIAKRQILDSTRVAFGGKMFLSYARRFMLLNIGDVSSTMITIVFTSMEEAVMRAFLIEIDTYIRKIMGKPKLHGRTLELQRFVWSIDINQSSIAEFVAIIVSSFAYVLLKPHALAINLGYKHERLCLGVLLCTAHARVAS